jgi:hypothetical protein
MRQGGACNDREKHIRAIDHTQGENRQYRQSPRPSHSLTSTLSATQPPLGLGRSGGKSASITAHSSSETNGFAIPESYHIYLRFC